jgi:hypothetical protein
MPAPVAMVPAIRPKSRTPLVGLFIDPRARSSYHEAPFMNEEIWPSVPMTVSVMPIFIMMS